MGVPLGISTGAAIATEGPITVFSQRRVSDSAAVRRWEGAKTTGDLRCLIRKPNKPEEGSLDRELNGFVDVSAVIGISKSETPPAIPYREMHGQDWFQQRLRTDLDCEAREGKKPATSEHAPEQVVCRVREVENSISRPEGPRTPGIQAKRERV
jgi:hypothetical protein